MSALEQLATVLATVRPLEPATVALPDALGLVLARTLASRVDIPVFDNSAMDGYAVRSADARPGIALPVDADIAAGESEVVALAPATAARIMTGAPLPEGADAVVPVEQTSTGRFTSGSAPRHEVTLHASPSPGAHIRRAGEDLHAGDTVLDAGIVLGPRQLAAAAGSGHGEVFAHPAPRVAVIATGSELVPPGEPLGPGRIPDSNSTLLAGCVRDAGAVTVAVLTVGDDAALLRDTLDGLAGSVDAFVLSGGVSAGAFDVVKTVLSEAGTVRFSAVRMQPGKPQAFGTWRDGRPLFGLPGNPVSAFVSFEMFVRPALLRMRGLTETTRPRAAAVAEADWSSPRGREQFMPVVVDSAADEPLRVRPAARRGSGSHLLASLARADGLAVVPADVEQVRAGESVAVMLLS